MNHVGDKRGDVCFKSRRVSFKSHGVCFKNDSVCFKSDDAGFNVMNVSFTSRRVSFKSGSVCVNSSDVKFNTGDVCFKSDDVAVAFLPILLVILLCCLPRVKRDFFVFGVIFRHLRVVDAKQAFFEEGRLAPLQIYVEAFSVYPVAADAKQAC